MLKKLVVLLLFSGLLMSCGAGKNAKGNAKMDAEAIAVVQNHYNNELDFRTISGRLRAQYQDDEKTQAISLSYRIKKDEAIWMSASVLGFPVAKVYITPKSVSYYEKINKTYFEGDFRLVSDWLGTPMDFKKIQNLLIGQAIYDLRDEGYDFSRSASGFQFVSRKEWPVKKMFLLDPSNFKASAQQLVQDSQNRSVTVTYSDYQKLGARIFPQEIKIIANESGESTIIEVRYRSVNFNEELSFPFRIPSGYEEISIK